MLTRAEIEAYVQEFSCAWVEKRKNLRTREANGEDVMCELTELHHQLMKIKALSRMVHSEDVAFTDVERCSYALEAEVDQEILRLRLVFDDIANAPVADPTDLMAWLQLNFIAFQVDFIIVNGNAVDFYGPKQGGALYIGVLAAVAGTHVLEIDDQGLVTQLQMIQAALFPSLLAATFPEVVNIFPNAMQNTNNLESFSGPKVTTIWEDAFYLSGPFNASFPLCTSIRDRSFMASNITNASFPLITAIPNSAFRQTGGISSYSFPLVTAIGDSAFRQSNIPYISFANVISCAASAFKQCEATYCVMPLCESLGLECITVCDNLTSLYLPALQTGANDCISTNANLTSINLPVCITLGAGAAQLNPALTSFTAPELISAGRALLSSCFSIIFVDIQKCSSLGNTVGDDDVFRLISGNTIDFFIAASMATVDAGNPDGDIIYLEANNTVATNYI